MTQYITYETFWLNLNSFVRIYDLEFNDKI